MPRSHARLFFILVAVALLAAGAAPAAFAAPAAVAAPALKFDEAVDPLIAGG